MEETIPTPETSAYSKRPLWQWITIYVIIGVVVYGAIYYFFLAKKGGYTYTPAPQGETESAPTATPEAAVQSKAAISLSSSGFNPKTLTVTVGTKVIWANTSSAIGNVSSSPHPAHTDYPPLNLGNIPADGSVSLVFDKPGTYKYHNHLNTSQFGSITVQ